MKKLLISVVGIFLLAILSIGSYRSEQRMAIQADPKPTSTNAFGKFIKEIYLPFSALMSLLFLLIVVLIIKKEKNDSKKNHHLAL
ncbi:hypothetical protein [Pedobacter sp. ASV28]|uniref:hypothetical protein n=1 Tax=Pedobacter sp. ASV28 TaxID=2795123 RepID=UPI0018EB1803|nr:hypothetical protein [Pedobacter sp. ASV28]